VAEPVTRPRSLRPLEGVAPGMVNGIVRRVLGVSHTDDHCDK